MNRAVVATLTAAMALGIAVFFTLYSLVPVTRADDPAVSSLFVGVMLACVIAVQVFTPALVRRFSLRLAIAVPLAALAVGALVTGAAQGTPEQVRKYYPDEWVRFVNDPYAYRAPRAESYHDLCGAFSSIPPIPRIVARD